MNVYQSIPRRDCRVFAKCGAKSLSHCRRHRGTDGECKNCTLIHRKPRNRIIDASGREMKKCTHCGNYFYLNRFFILSILLFTASFFKTDAIKVFRLLVRFMLIRWEWWVR